MKKEDIDSSILLQNNSPLSEFEGLTPSEVHSLLYDPFGAKSLIQFRNDIDTALLDQVPFFRIAEEFLKLVQKEKQIKLTPLGALPRKVMHELYAHKFLSDYFIERGVSKLNREEDCVSISTARLTTSLAGLVKKSVGKLSLTKEGSRVLQPENRLKFFKSIFSAYTIGFSWSYNDRYPDHPVGQLGFGFSLYLLDKFGDQELPCSFYADKYLKAFPKFLQLFPDDQYSTGISRITHCYCLRTIEHFFEWFGLVNVERTNKFLERENLKLKRSDLLNEIFAFD